MIELPPQFAALAKHIHSTHTWKLVGNGWLEITVGDMDRHNDHMQIYVKPHENHDGYFILSDDGWTTDELRTSGYDLTDPHIVRLLRVLFDRFDAVLDDEHLTVMTSVAAFIDDRNNLLDAMKTIDRLLGGTKTNL